VSAVLTGNGVFRFPLRRLGRGGFGHGFLHHLAWHALWRFSLGSALIWIVVLLVVALVVRRLVSRRRTGSPWRGPSDRF
jgi:hypothetical protein